MFLEQLVKQALYKTRFLMLDIDETFIRTSQGYLEELDTIPSCIKNIPVLLVFSMCLGGFMQSLLGS